MNNRVDKSHKLITYNLNDEVLNASRNEILSKITNRLQTHYSQYINFPDEFWIKLVNDRLAKQLDGIPFTLVVLKDNEDGSKQFVGTISAERGCEELNDTSHVWITGFYVEESFRRQGIGLLLCKEILKKFETLNVSSFYLWTHDLALDQLYAYFGTKTLDKPVVLGFPLVIRTGETRLILDNINQYLSQQEENNKHAISNNQYILFANKQLVTPNINFDSTSLFNLNHF